MIEAIRSRQLKLLVSTTLVGLLMCLAMASSSSAMDIGLMAADNAWQEEAQWDVIDHSGVNQFRLMIRPEGWPGSGSWKTLYDNAFRCAAERGIKIIPYFYNFNGAGKRFLTEAEWKATGTGSWDEWVKQIVQRYGYNGTFWTEAGHPANYLPPTAWEVWNEENRKENNPLLWDGTQWIERVQPANYARFLKHTSIKINDVQKAQNNGVGTEILYGGLYSPLATSLDSQGRYISASVADFLKSGHVENVGEYFNGLSLHPYSFASGGLQGFKNYVIEARNALNLYNATKIMWLTEVGWPVGTNPEDVSEATQAQLLTDCFNWARSVAGTYYISDIIWFDYRDTNSFGNWADRTGLRAQAAGFPFKSSWYRLEEQTGAKAWPVAEWHTDNLGGNITSDPDISSWEPGRLDVFARGTNGELLHRWYRNNEWSWWENLGGNIAAGSGPSSVSWAPGRIDVVARGTDNSVLHWGYSEGVGWALDNLGGNIASDPEIASREYGHLEIYAKNTQNNLIYKWYLHGEWSNWVNLGGTLASGPGATSWNQNALDVVARAPDNTVTHWGWNSTSGWAAPDTLGGNIASDPDMASMAYGQLEVFAKSPEGTLVHKWYRNGEWSTWQSLGGNIISGPGAVSWGPERTDVVARAPDNTVSRWTYGLLLPP